MFSFVASRLLAWPRQSARSSGRRRRRDRPGPTPRRPWPRFPACRRCVDPANLYSETTAGKLSADGRRRSAARLRPARAVERRLRDRSRHAQGRRPVQGGDQSAARRAVVGPAHAVGRQQRGEHEARQPHADRSANGQARQGRSRSTIRTTCISRRTASRRSSSPRPSSGSISAIRTRWRCSLRWTCRTAAASTTPISRSTAATRSSPASSRAPWPRSTSSNRKVLGYTQVIQPGRPTKVVKGPDGKDEVICTTWKGMPQDIRASPDGKLFFVADMMADGVHVVDGETFRQIGFIETGKGDARALSRAATARSSTSPIAARTRSTGRRRARAACR